METASKLGFRKGDFVHTGAFPGVVIGQVHTRTPLCEVWGLEHEMGSAYAEDLQALTWPEFKTLAGRFGFDGSADSDEAKAAIAKARGEEASASAVAA